MVDEIIELETVRMKLISRITESSVSDVRKRINVLLEQPFLFKANAGGES